MDRGKFSAMVLAAFCVGALQVQQASADDNEGSLTNWNGIHFDLGLGAGAAVNETTLFSPATLVDPASTSVVNGVGAEGIFGTIGFGYDFQHNHFVMGAFADFDLSGLKTTVKTNEPGTFNSESILIISGPWEPGAAFWSIVKHCSMA